MLRWTSLGEVREDRRNSWKDLWTPNSPENFEEIEDAHAAFDVRFFWLDSALQLQLVDLRIVFLVSSSLATPAFSL